jgi:hypothetical protein
MQAKGTPQKAFAEQIGMNLRHLTAMKLLWRPKMLLMSVTQCLNSIECA